MHALIFGSGPKLTKALYTTMAHGPSEWIHHELTVAGCRGARWCVLPKCDVTKLVFLELGGHIFGCLEEL